MLFKVLILFLLNCSISSSQGFNFRTITGISVNYTYINEISTLAGAGIEYKLNINKLMFLSCEAGFPFFDLWIDKHFSIYSTTSGRFNFLSFLGAFKPIFYLRYGLNISNYTSITLGLFYLWGIDLGLRRKISDNLSFDLGFNWMFDRILFENGLHDLHITFGFRYGI